jgi:hypothetical protein
MPGIAECSANLERQKAQDGSYGFTRFCEQAETLAPDHEPNLNLTSQNCGTFNRDLQDLLVWRLATINDVIRNRDPASRTSEWSGSIAASAR